MDLSAQDIVYAVKPGDTLYMLSRQYNTTVEAIVGANPGIDFRRIRVGQRIHIPQGRGPDMDMVSGATMSNGLPGAVSGTMTNNGMPSAVSGAAMNKGMPSAVSGTATNNGQPSAVSGAAMNKGMPSAVSGAATNNGLPSAVSGAAAGQNKDLYPAISGATMNNGMPSAVSGAAMNNGMPSAVSGAAAGQNKDLYPAVSGTASNNGQPSAVSGATMNNGQPSAVSGAAMNKGMASAVLGAATNKWTADGSWAMPRMSDPPAMTAAQVRDSLRRLWEQHAYWTRMAIISVEAGSADLQDTTARLMRNAQDMADALRQFYGGGSVRFGDLLRAHINITLRFVAAEKAGNAALAASVEREWYANADEIARYLHSLNSYISEDSFRRTLYAYLDLVKQEISLRLARNYGGDTALFDRVENEALDIADTLAAAIIRQFSL